MIVVIDELLQERPLRGSCGLGHVVDMLIIPLPTVLTVRRARAEVRAAKADVYELRVYGVRGCPGYDEEMAEVKVALAAAKAALKISLNAAWEAADCARMDAQDAYRVAKSAYRAADKAERKAWKRRNAGGC